MSEFDASASAVGHLHQIRWAMLDLLRAGRKDRSMRVSLEAYDDIATHGSDGVLMTAKQMKHHRKPGNLTDGSKDLWGTLRVWLSTPSLKDANGPQLYLLTTESIVPGSAVSYLTVENSDPEKACSTLTELAKSLTGKGTSKARKLWADSTNADRLGVLQRVKVFADSPHISEINALLREELAVGVWEEHLDTLIERLWGWWFEMVTQVLNSDEIRYIGADQLYTQINVNRDELTAGALPIDYSLEDVEDADLLQHRTKPFVHQLEWIGVRNVTLRKALVDYHRAYAQNAKWVKDGDLVEEDLTRFERRLVEEWHIEHEAMCDRLELLGTADEPSKIRAGRELFNRMYNSSAVRIRPDFTEAFLANGTRHKIADTAVAGWHPDFEARMRELLGVAA